MLIIWEFINLDLTNTDTLTDGHRRTRDMTKVQTAGQTYWFWLGGEVQVVMIELFFLFP